MKRHPLTKRVAALLLAVLLTVSAVPTSVYAAAVGDVAAGYVAGTTGLSGNINTADSISWPIKIYDYLNDGMLFEYSSSTGTATTNWVYAGGERMPEQDIVGYDYTLNGGYTSAVNSTTGLSTGSNTALGSGAYGKSTYSKWWGHSSSPFSATQVGKGTPGAFKYLRIALKSGKALKAMALTSFYFDSSQKTRDSVRYVTIVYRTNISSPSIKISFANQTASGATATLYDSAGSACGSYIPSVSSTALTTSADTWIYKVIDLAEVSDSSRWNNTSYIYSVILDIEKMAAGGSEYLDLSHVAYFSDEASAINYGKDAAAFSNDPGEYLPDQRETIIPYVPETDDETDTVSPPSGASTHCLDFTSQNTNEATVIDLWKGSGYKLSVTKGTSNNKSYVKLTNGTSGTGRDAIRIYHAGNYSEASGIQKSDAKYISMVYRIRGFSSTPKLGAYGIVGATNSSANSYTGQWFNRADNNGDATTDGVESNEIPMTAPPNTDTWVYLVYDLTQIDSTKTANQYYNGAYSSSYPYITYLYCWLPGFTDSNQSIDLAYVDVHATWDEANNFGAAGATYMNTLTTSSSTTTTTTPTTGNGYKHWNMTGNVAYAMLFSSQGNGWNPITWTENGTSYTTDRGGANSWPSGYYSYPIGEHLAGTGLGSLQYKNNITRHQIPSDLDYVVSDDIFSFSFDSSSSGYKTDDLPLGYQLLTTGTSGLCTIGLLESSLATVKAGNNNYKILQYKNDTIDYIAQLLEATLTIPQTDKYGNYNYSFIQGSKSSQFAYTYDASANTVTTGITVDGKSQSKVDLATALRTRLGITFRSDMDKAATQPARGKAAQLTAEKRSKLVGQFMDVVPYIETFADAAYYLLHNIFVDDSYSQLQDEYNYLVLSKGTVATSGKEAYIFDGGFSTGTGMTDTDGNFVADGDYAQRSQSAVVYDKTAGTISLSCANSKDLIYYQTHARTTRFPFLPITDATGDYAGPSKSYFAEDAIEELKPNSIGYRDRNYNYVIQANGEFVYHVDDALFFDFEGDDDVYLFVNDELVLDIGGAHSITKVGFNMNDYVDKARSLLVGNDALPGYYTGMSDSDFEAILAASNLDAATKESYRRWHKLDLADGQSYAIDFYYMERHGYGANMRIATNIVMTDPSMQTNKTAYQGGDEIPYGGIADKDQLVEYSFSITNSGNNKLYDLTMTDTTIGVKLDKESGLVISNAAGKNANAVFDKDGGTLDVSDLTINISGYTGPNLSGPVSVDVTLPDNAALKKYMEDLTSPNTQTEDTSSLYAGSGLWKDATVTVRGIYVNLNKVAFTGNQFPNTLETTAATAIGSKTLLNGKDTHMVRVMSSGIQFYMWAGHYLGIRREDVFSQMTDEAKLGLLPDSQKNDPSTNLANLKPTWTWMTPCLANGTAYNWAGVTVTQSEGTTATGVHGTLLRLDFQKPGKYVFYLRVWRSGNNGNGWPDQFSIIPVTVYVADVEDDVMVLDYGLKAELTGEGGIKANDTVSFGNSSYSIMSMTTNGSAVSYMKYTNSAYSTGDANRISFPAKDGTSLTTGDGTFTVTDDTDDRLYFQPTDFMDEPNTMYMAVTVHDKTATPNAVGPANASSGGAYKIDISKEVQMYQKVTVVPANVVYYEDDFTALRYSDDSGSFTHHGAGSGTLIQSADQTTPYGQDPAYASNNKMSGNSLKEYAIEDDAVFASFDFTGTGFEILSRTDATTCGTMIVQVTNEADELVRHMPVITEFDNHTNGNGGSEVIYQVPVIRVEGLEPGRYHVTVSGSPEYDVEASKDLWKEDEQGELLPPLSRYQNALYIDGIRIFQPMGADPRDEQDVPYYNDREAGAKFYEVRQLLLDSQLAFVNWTSVNSGFQACTGNMIWTENRNGLIDANDQSYDANLVDSIEDYLVYGPNNELYFRRTTDVTGTQNPNGTEVTNRQMLLFYVREDDSNAGGSVQIALRAQNFKHFQSKDSIMGIAMDLFYLKATTTSVVETKLAQIGTGTEQYVQIDYTTCPYTTDAEGRRIYSVMLLARTNNNSDGMLSFTSLKTSGLTVLPVFEVDSDLTEDQILSGTTWTYDSNGMLVNEEGRTYGSTYLDLRQLARTIQTVEQARTLAEKRPIPEVQTAVPTPAPELMSKQTKLILLGIGSAIALVGAWWLTRKYLHLL